MKNIRIGFGYDVHQLKSEHPFYLGGIKIEHTKGAYGHSDADVLLHVICDAMLGAANLRDIGFHFPDTSADYKNIDSKILLRRTFELISEKGYEIGNMDCTICLQTPKINPQIPAMQAVIAEILNTTIDNISIKATTSEKIGFVGREEGIAAYCTVLLFAS